MMCLAKKKKTTTAVGRRRLPCKAIAIATRRSSHKIHIPKATRRPGNEIHISRTTRSNQTVRQWNTHLPRYTHTAFAHVWRGLGQGQQLDDIGGTAPRVMKRVKQTKICGAEEMASILSQQPPPPPTHTHTSPPPCTGPGNILAMHEHEAKSK